MNHSPCATCRLHPSPSRHEFGSWQHPEAMPVAPEGQHHLAAGLAETRCSLSYAIPHRVNNGSSAGGNKADRRGGTHRSKASRPGSNGVAASEVRAKPRANSLRGYPSRLLTVTRLLSSASRALHCFPQTVDVRQRVRSWYTQHRLECDSSPCPSRISSFTRPSPDFEHQVQSFRTIAAQQTTMEPARALGGWGGLQESAPGDAFRAGIGREVYMDDPFCPPPPTAHRAVHVIGPSRSPRFACRAIPRARTKRKRMDRLSCRVETRPDTLHPIQPSLTADQGQGIRRRIPAIATPSPQETGPGVWRVIPSTVISK